MNRYPLWQYITMFVVVLIAAIYALPNYFGEAPAVQVSPARALAAIDEPLKQRALAALETSQLQPVLVEQQGNSLLLRFDGTDAEIKVWKEKALPVYDMYKDKMGAEIYNKVMNAAK